MRKKILLLLGTVMCILVGCSDTTNDEKATAQPDGDVVTESMGDVDEDVSAETGFHGLDEVLDITDEGKGIVEVDGEDTEMDVVHGTHDFRLCEFSYNGTMTNAEDCYDTLIANGWTADNAVGALDGEDDCVSDGINPQTRIQDVLNHSAIQYPLGTGIIITLINNTDEVKSPQDSNTCNLKFTKVSGEDDSVIPIVFADGITWDSTADDIVRVYGTPSRIHYYAEDTEDARTQYEYDKDDIEFRIEIEDKTGKIVSFEYQKDHYWYFPLEED